MVSAISSTRGFAAIMATSRCRSRRKSGSPPVRRTCRTPTNVKTSTSSGEFLEGQQFRARQPGVFLLGHAVEAAQIAAVGDREAQALEGPAEQVAHWDDWKSGCIDDLAYILEMAVGGVNRCL